MLRAAFAVLLALTCIWSGARAQFCEHLVASAGRSVQWPVSNPALVAPVTASYDVKPYRSPLLATRTDTSIVVAAPPDLECNFFLTDANGTLEKYSLSTMEVRKPGVMPADMSPLSHVLELVLVHRAPSGVWASVVIPLNVVGNPPNDVLTPIFSGAVLPTEVGHISPVHLQSAMPLDLTAAWASTFYASWSVLPTSCPGVKVPARHLLRSTTMATSPATFSAISLALRSVRDRAPPLRIEALFWLMTACPMGSTCAPPVAQNLAQDLQNATSLYQAQVTALWATKARLDSAIALLQDLTGQNATNAAFNNATALRAKLVQAQLAVDGSKATVQQINGWISQASSAVWDGDRPTGTGPAPAAAAAAGSAKPSVVLLAFGRRDHALVATSCSRSQAPSQRVDLARAQHVDAAKLEFLHRAMHFQLPAALRLRVRNNGDHLRIMALPEGSPLLTVSVFGSEMPIAFMDVTVPGEHLMDGSPSPAEVQLVHLPLGGQAVVVALRLGEAGDNDWLSPVLSSAVGQERTVGAEDLTLLHGALRRGVAGHYFAYDGLLPRSPCGRARWYVLEEVGHIGSGQLTALLQSMPQAAEAAEAAPIPTSLLFTSSERRPLSLQAALNSRLRFLRKQPEAPSKRLRAVSRVQI